jgi:hypothetical protein
MATMIVELYEALKAAGAPEDKAQAAAKVLANTDERFDRVDAKLGALDARLATVQAELVAKLARLEAEFGIKHAKVEAELGMVKWIVSGVGFGVLLLVLRSFWPGA